MWVIFVAAAVYGGVYAASARWGLTFSPTQRFGIGVAAGALVLEDRWGSRTPPPAGGSFRTSRQHSTLYPFRHRFGFVWWYRATASATGPAVPLLGGLPLVGGAFGGPTYRSLKIPLWMPPAPVLLVLGLVVLIRRRVPPGHCRGCRYDLRGTTGPVCPECGRAREAPVKEAGTVPE